MKEKRHLSLIIIMFTLALFCSYHIYYYFLKQQNEILVNEYINSDFNKKIVSKINNTENKEEYLGIIEINKIKLKKGFYRKNSSKNIINQNIMLLSESIMPDKDNSIIYLAAHSGTGYLAFFKDIDKLTNQDIINLYYQDKKYTYLVTDIYEYPKNGQIIVNRNIHESYLVLTTCSHNKNMQLVIISKQIKGDLS